MKKAVIAMSGGVDSSVAAYLLLQKEIAVEGVFFLLFETPQNLDLAKQVAQFLGINLHIEDLREKFKEKVVEPFFEGYRKGITPNPCILCNRYIKFPSLKKVTDSLKAQIFATGHYARILKRNGSFYLLKGIDRKKDQSYFLYAIEKSFLRELTFPLGKYTKDEVKKIAQEAKIPSKTTEESAEVCFLKDKKYYEMIKGVSSGPIIEKSTGKIVGHHRGIHLFTIGQRKRIGVSLGYPAYVVKVDPNINAVYVSCKEHSFMKEFYVDDINWLCEPEESPFSCEVKIRYAMNPEKATVKLINSGRAKVSFDKPQFAPTPGQSAVFYKEEVVLGGGTITEILQEY